MDVSLCLKGVNKQRLLMIVSLICVAIYILLIDTWTLFHIGKYVWGDKDKWLMEVTLTHFGGNPLRDAPPVGDVDTSAFKELWHHCTGAVDAVVDAPKEAARKLADHDLHLRETVVMLMFQSLLGRVVAQLLIISAMLGFYRSVKKQKRAD